MKDKARNRKIKLRMVLPVVVMAAVGADLSTSRQPPEKETHRFTGMGHPEVLASRVEAWRLSRKSTDEVVLALRQLHDEGEGRSRGEVRLNLVDGRLLLVLDQSGDSPQVAWLVDYPDNGKGRAVSLRLGQLTPGDGQREILATTLDSSTLPAGFHIDAVTVAPRGGDPVADALVAGRPSLLQKLAFYRQPWAVARVGGVLSPPPAEASAFAFLLPPPAVAAPLNNSNNLLVDLVAEGHRLFHEETFAGNGRTCGTCHREDNNFTIDPQYIARLPADDPLFVFANDPQLAGLENPRLLREMALFQANVDGFDKPPVLRGVPHLQSLVTSSNVESKDSVFIANSTGWSGDGAPGDGSLRMFAVGAIRQHMTRTLNRVAGVDFRLPTEHELDALEAYMLSLGRQRDPDLAAMTFLNPIVERGKELFNTEENPVDGNGEPVFGQSANCMGCHSNAGGRSSTTHANPIRDTGVENAYDMPHRLLDPSIAYDGGFGRQPRNCGPDFDHPCYGDGRFSTQTVIEAADTPPFFHNNSVNTIEQVVAFYTGPAFNNSPGALTGSGGNRQIHLDGGQATALALFMRAINAVENIDSSVLMDVEAQSLGRDAGEEAVELALAETRDAIEDLTGGVYNVYPEALRKLRRAHRLEKHARDAGSIVKRNRLLEKAILLKQAARDLIVREG